MDDCNICKELSGIALNDSDVRYANLIEHKKNIIMQTEDFVVIPSIGPLNDSHAMIVPRLHLNNFASIDKAQRNQVENLIISLSKKIAAKHKKQLVFFESGTGSLCKHSGGCIIHAHIHCLYSNDDFEKNLLEELMFEKPIQDWQDIASITEGYVWYKSIEGTSYVANNPQLPSQFLRYLYSASTGDVRHWNWRRHNNYSGVLSVIQNYGKTP